MKNLTELFETLEKTSGHKDKIKLLKDYDDNQSNGMLRAILHVALDPYCIFGVGSFDNATLAKLHSRKVSHYGIDDIFWADWLQTLRELETSKGAGKWKKNKVFQVLSEASEIQVKWGLRVLLKDLRIGLGEGLINKVFPKLISKFQVGLCGSLDLDEEWAEEFPFMYMEPKYNGVRGLLFTSSGTVFSRGGRPLDNMEKLVADAKKLLPSEEDWVLDGEVMGKSWNDTISAVHSDKNRKANVEDLKFYIFDILTEKEYHNQKTPSLDARKDRMNFLLGEKRSFGSIILVPVNEVFSMEGVKYNLKKYEAAGYEGLVLKDPQSQYPFGRSQSWLKVKSVKSDEFKIVSVQGGKGKHSGKLGAFIVKDLDEKSKFRPTHVGSGFSDEQREEFWKKKGEMIGRIIEVEFQERNSTGSLTFPRFLRFRVDKEEGR